MAMFAGSGHLSTPIFGSITAPRLARASSTPNLCRLHNCISSDSAIPNSLDFLSASHRTLHKASFSTSGVLPHNNLHTRSDLTLRTKLMTPRCFKHTATSNMCSTDQSEVSSVIESPVSPTNLETPLSSPNASVFDITEINDLLIESLCQGIPLGDIEQTLIRIARHAGEMILAADPTVDDSDTKNNSSDRVTATDKAVEHMVYTTLKTTYPAFNFLGEETFKEGTKLTDAATFVCDPVDGTLNFIHGFPNTAVSLALTVARKPVVGVVYNPFRGDLFTAIKGAGAFLTRHDGRRIRLPAKRNPAPLSALNDCLVAIEWGNQRSGPNWDLRTSVHKKLLSSPSPSGSGAMVHSIRSSGSAALDFCYVAAGWLDVFWEAGVWLWDVAAGWLVLEEAGGFVASANPGVWDPELESRCYLAVRAAADPEGQRKVVKELWELMDGKSFAYPVKK